MPLSHPCLRGYSVEAMTHVGALLLAADRTPLAERHLLASVKYLVKIPCSRMRTERMDRGRKRYAQ